LRHPTLGIRDFGFWSTDATPAKVSTITSTSRKRRLTIRFHLSSGSRKISWTSSRACFSGMRNACDCVYDCALRYGVS
jgi:hypothetical protein